MTRNEGTTDRIIRGGIAATALGTGLAIGGVFNPVGGALLGVSVVAGLTAVSGYCPLYSVLGISTVSSSQQA